MRASTSDVVNADLTKIHAEINQFRNHEFLVSSGAIAAFATTAQELPKTPLLGVGVLLLLLGLFFWHYVLTDTRSRLSAYLRVTSCSLWEMNYRRFADRTRTPGQRGAAVITFMVLGALTILTSFLGAIQASFEEKSTVVFIPWLFGCYAIVAIPYFCIVYYFGRMKYQPLVNRYEELWKEVLAGQRYEPRPK